MVLHLARERSGLTLARIGADCGGQTDKSVSAHVRRLRKRMEQNGELRAVALGCLRRIDEMANIEL